MKRRSFLGFMGGAVASGPKLAKGLADDALSLPPAHGYGFSPAAAAIDHSWRKSRISELKRLISGDDPYDVRTKEMVAVNSSETAERYRLDSLRSVSSTFKYRMLVAGEPTRTKRIRRLHHRWELADLLKDDS